jgi:hypothetical protein
MPSSPTCCAGHPATAAHSTTPLRRPTARRRARRACRIVYQLRTGVPWRLLPAGELGSPATCWRRLRDWQRAGSGGVCTTCCSISSAATASSTGPEPAWTRSACAPNGGGELTSPNPIDRGKPGSKYHLLVDRGDIPLAVGLSAANTHDSMLLEPMVDAVPPVKGPRGCPGRPRRRPANDLVRDCSGWPRHRLASTRMKGPRR